MAVHCGARLTMMSAHGCCTRSCRLGQENSRRVTGTRARLQPSSELLSYYSTSHSTFTNNSAETSRQQLGFSSSAQQHSSPNKMGAWGYGLYGCVDPVLDPPSANTTKAFNPIMTLISSVVCPPKLGLTSWSKRTSKLPRLPARK